MGVYRNGDVLYAKGYGMANLESPSIITPETVFHVASVSKHFTAFAVLLLAHEGKIDLDGDIRAYLPYVPDFGRKITVRHLILHVSGMRDYESLLNFSGLSGNTIITQSNVIELISRQKGLSFDPGSDFAYNNTGYALMAEIVKAVTGQSLRAFATERIFRPLNMKDTAFSDDLQEVVDRRADAYSRGESGVWQRGILNQAAVGATGVRTTIMDMARWAANFNNPVVGSRALMEEFMQPGALDDGQSLIYGFGLERSKIDGRDVVSHAGGEGKFSAMFMHFPAEKLSVVVLANTPAGTGTLAEKVAQIYLGQSSAESVPSFFVPTRVGITAAQVKALAGLYASDGSVLRVEGQGAVATLRSGSAPVEIVMRADGTVDLGDEPRARGQFYRLERGASGTVLSLQAGWSADNNSRPVRYKRVQPVDEHALDLKPYTGRYYSTELDTTYTVYVDDGVLKATNLRSANPLRLQPLYRDAFQAGSWMFSHLAFERRGASKAHALLLTNGRARNVRFERVK